MCQDKGKKGFGLRGVSCGKVTRKQWRELVGDRATLLGLTAQFHLAVNAASPVMSLFSQGGHLRHRKCHALLFIRNEVRESFLYLLFLRCLLLKIINISIVAYFGVTYWFPSGCSSYPSLYVQHSVNIYIEYLY